MSSDYQVQYLIEKYKLEYENIVISLINTGWSKSDAKIEAAERIHNRYCQDEVLETEE